MDKDRKNLASKHAKALIDEHDFESASPTIKKWLTHIAEDTHRPEDERSSAKKLLETIAAKDKQLSETKSITLH